jgi:ABC-type lipoprotein release transport system permease subunit
MLPTWNLQLRDSRRAVSELDPVTYGGAIALRLGISALASAVPASRAAWVDPAITLRLD